MQAFAEALLIVPKTLAERRPRPAGRHRDAAGPASRASRSAGSGLGRGLDTQQAGVWDNFRVKRQIVQAASLTAMQLLLVDEVMRRARRGKDVDKY